MDRDEERFWAKVPHRPSDPAACWEFEGGRDQDGYGMFWFNGRTMHATRYIWSVTDGSIPAGLFVCHRCDNPPCVRRGHLFLGSPRDNTGDASAKGRMARGEGHPLSRLAERDVRRIRQLFSDEVPKAQIAREVGCSRWTVTKIVDREAWKHVTEP